MGGPILNSAISAVEIALWDILGQAVGQPIYILLGGKARERVQMYVHAGGRTPEEYARNWKETQDEGWTACKGGFVTTQNDRIDRVRAVRDGIANLKAVREAVGPDFRICIDVHGKATPTMAVDFCRRAEEYAPYFVEEATQIEDIDELAHLRSKTTIPLATGERLVYQMGLHRDLRTAPRRLRPTRRRALRRHLGDEEDRHHRGSASRRVGAPQPAEQRQHHGVICM